MMTWCWCHPHKLLHTHPRSQRGCDLVEKVDIVILFLLRNIIIDIAIIAMIIKLSVSWMFFSSVFVTIITALFTSTRTSVIQFQSNNMSQFDLILSSYWIPVWSNMIHNDPLWSSVIQIPIIWLSLTSTTATIYNAVAAFILKKVTKISQ